MTRVTLRPKGQVTLPSEVREVLHVEPGDELEFVVTDSGQVLLRGLKMIPADQAWFWTREWQEGEKAAEEDIRAGRLSEVFADAGELFDHLAPR